jgi:hypothetical protein
MRILSVFVALATLLAIASPAGAQALSSDYFNNQTTDDDLSFRVDKPRTNTERIVIASLFGGALVFGGLGVAMHVRSSNKSDEVSSEGEHTGLVWTPERDSIREDAELARTLSIGAYSIGGGLVIAGLVTFILTDPGTEVVKIGEDTQPSAQTTFSIVPGGAVVGSEWSF